MYKKMQLVIAGLLCVSVLAGCRKDAKLTSDATESTAQSQEMITAETTQNMATETVAVVETEESDHYIADLEELTEMDEPKETEFKEETTQETTKVTAPTEWIDEKTEEFNDSQDNFWGIGGENELMELG